MDTEPFVPQENTRQSRPRFHFRIYGFLMLCILGIVGFYSVSAPEVNRSFINNQAVIVHVAEGDSLATLARELQVKQIIRSESLLKILLRIFSLDGSISRGDYLFTEKESLLKVAWRFARARHEIEPIKIMFKEGSTLDDMADILADTLPGFRRDLFLSDELSREGYLFPSTYFFFPYTTSHEVVRELSLTFKKQIASLSRDIENSHHTQNEIIVMASILEKEARGKDDIALISGILWKRIDRGMLLQVDAAPDTYKTKGLPSVPIANPGMASLTAALHPVSSSYLFYLHSKDGVVHFARTYEEHKRNITQYLK